MDFGPAQLVNADNPKSLIEIDIHRTVFTTLERITEEEARADGFLSLGQLHSAMKKHYPDIVIEEPVTVYHFARTDRDGG